MHFQNEKLKIKVAIFSKDRLEKWPLDSSNSVFTWHSTNDYWQWFWPLGWDINGSY